MARTMVIGDVHGMAVELAALIEKVQPVAGDKFVFAGDLLDKGPDSAGVVRMVRGLRERGFSVTLVEGNHEEKHRRFRRNLVARPEVARTMGGAEEMTSITASMTEEDVAFLATAVPYAKVEGGFTVVHGGVPPVLSSLDAPKAFDVLCRTRFVGKETGKMLALGEASEADPFWADVYDGRFGHVLFGHHPFIGSKPGRFAHATGLDTGAVFGGSLTTAVIAGGRVEGFVSVPASHAYATPKFD